MRYLFLLISFLMLNILLHAQNNNSNIELDSDYFQKKEFEKAVVIYEQLYNQTGSKLFFDFLFTCFLELKQYDNAEKIIKKYSKTNNNALSDQVLWVKLYKHQGKNDKASELINKTINKLKAEESEIISLANAFIADNDYQSALAVYDRGKKLVSDKLTFHNNLAAIYQHINQYDKMIEEYLSLLEIDESYLYTIQNNLQELALNDNSGTFLSTIKTVVLKKIQSNNKSIVTYKLLIWIFLQEKDFNAALTHAKSIDLRTSSNSDMIMEIGNIALSNNEFDVAINAFDYIKQKGNENSLFIDAEINYILALNRKILTITTHTKEEEFKLEQQLKQTISQYKADERNIPLIIDLAHLQTYYLNKADTAISLLENSIASNNISLDLKSKLRMKLAEIYLFNDNIWEANLVYAKVEMDKNGTPISNEAKFDRAKIAYYLGDFKWASALLDILKAATSKETANDAFELSLLITDNMDEDSSNNALRMFAHADYLFLQRQIKTSLATYDSIPKLFPGHQLEDDILYRKAGIFELTGNIDSAISLYKQITTRFGYDIYADNSLFKLGIIYETQKHDFENALIYYKKIISDYSNSIYVYEARNRYRKLSTQGKL